jgi:hypothetical protein
MAAHRQLPLHVVMPDLKKPIPKPPVERPVRRFSDCMDGGSFGALRSLGLVGIALRGDELNGWGELVGVVLVDLAQENNFLVGLAGAWRCSAAAGAGAEGGGVLWPWPLGSLGLPFRGVPRLQRRQGVSRRLSKLLNDGGNLRRFECTWCSGGDCDRGLRRVPSLGAAAAEDCRAASGVDVGRLA